MWASPSAERAKRTVALPLAFAGQEGDDASLLSQGLGQGFEASRVKIWAAVEDHAHAIFPRGSDQQVLGHESHLGRLEVAYEPFHFFEPSHLLRHQIRHFFGPGVEEVGRGGEQVVLGGVVGQGPVAAEEMHPAVAADALGAQEFDGADLAGVAHMGAAAGGPVEALDLHDADGPADLGRAAQGDFGDAGFVHFVGGDGELGQDQVIGYRLRFQPIGRR